MHPSWHLADFSSSLVSKLKTILGFLVSSRLLCFLPDFLCFCLSLSLCLRGRSFTPGLHLHPSTALKDRPWLSGFFLKEISSVIFGIRCHFVLFSSPSCCQPVRHRRSCRLCVVFPEPSYLHSAIALRTLGVGVFLFFPLRRNKNWFCSVALTLWSLLAFEVSLKSHQAPQSAACRFVNCCCHCFLKKWRVIDINNSEIMSRSGSHIHEKEKCYYCQSSKWPSYAPALCRISQVITADGVRSTRFKPKTVFHNNPFSAPFHSLCI